MPGYLTANDNQPLRYYKGRPIYLSGFITIALALGIVVTLLLESSGLSTDLLRFQTGLFLHGFYWQPLTYVLVNSLDFFTPLGLLAFYFWGGEIERTIGRRSFIGLFVTLVFTPIVYLFGYLLLFHAPGSATGLYALLCGLLVAFATLYPNLDYIGGWVPLKWFAFACIACGSLTHFPSRDWVGLFQLWSSCLAGFLYIRWVREEFSLPSFSWFSRRKFKVLPNPSPRSAPAPARKAAPVTTSGTDDDNVDAILDKIARSGLNSLSAAEKEKLERVRQSMLRRDS